MNIKPYQYLIDVRDRALIEWTLPVSPPGTSFTLILWDADRDARLLTVLEAMRYRNAMMIPAVVAVSESRGLIDFWCPSSADTTLLTRSLQSAADAALQPRDRWTVVAPTVVPVANGRMDFGALSATDPVRVAATRGQIAGFQTFGAL